MDKLNELVTKYGFEPYTKLPLVQKISQKTKIPPAAVIAGFFGLLPLYCFLPIVGNLLTTFILFLLPAYHTFKAIESPEKEDDQRLLTYWVVFGLVYSLDELLRSFLSFIPGYHIIRFVGLMALYVPNFNGSKVVYDRFARPLFNRYVSQIDALIEPLEERSRNVSEQFKKKQ